MGLSVYDFSYKRFIDISSSDGFASQVFVLQRASIRAQSNSDSGRWRRQLYSDTTKYSCYQWFCAHNRQSSWSPIHNCIRETKNGSHAQVSYVN